MQVLVVGGYDFNRAVPPVGAEVSRLVGNGVLAAQFVLNFSERVGHVAQLEREEGTAAGRVSDPLETRRVLSLGIEAAAGPRVAVLSILGFGVVLFSYTVVNLYLSRAHSFR